MVASGNDFVVIDNRSRLIQNPAEFARSVCRAHLGIGADGLLLVEKSSRAAFKMRIINSDGSEAGACGNGFRCISFYAHQKLGLPERFKFESQSGMISAQVLKGRIRVGLVRPRGYQDRKTLEVSGHRLHYSFINTGVPHTVILAEGLDKMDVNHLGRAVREHPAFQPQGTNVNFVEVNGLHEIRVRTYERGVENETLACGTGSTASALITSLAGYTKAPVKVKTRGGETLTIDFKIRNGTVKGVSLEGEVRFVFEGVLLT